MPSTSDSISSFTAWTTQLYQLKILKLQTGFVGQGITLLRAALQRPKKYVLEMWTSWASVVCIVDIISFPCQDDLLIAHIDVYEQQLTNIEIIIVIVLGFIKG